jgi:hypothetical protein
MSNSVDPAKAGINFIPPHFTLWNKEYQKPPFHDPLVKKLFLLHMEALNRILGLNRPETGALTVDDMLVWFRNLGFLSDPEFIAAMGPFAGNDVLRARIWRVYTLCWAARSCLGLEGDYMDLGCYDGKTVEVMARYCDFGKAQKTWWLYDMFENPPAEARKSGHGPQLHDLVTHNFAHYDNFRVIKGALPGSFEQGLPERIAFAQLDLNAAEPEMGCLEIIYDRLAPGAIVVFDDYGFRRYRDSHSRETDFFRSKGEIVWENPTGQGIYIKR